MSWRESVYDSSPIWAQNAFISLYGLHLQRLRYGGIHKHVLNAIRESEHYSSSQLRRLQLERLQEIVALARNCVPFYAKRGNADIRSLEDIRRLPILTKEEVREAGASMRNQRTPASELVEIHTGGTTGTPLTIYASSRVLQTNYAFFARFREWCGIRPNSRVATLAGRRIVHPSSGGPFWRHNFFAHTLLLSSYHISPVTADKYLGALARFKPDLIDSYPSNLQSLVLAASPSCLSSVRPKAIITSSETLDPAVRSVIERAFGCCVFDHYGAAEMAAFISQCEVGSYHVNPEFGIVEILRDGKPVQPGEEGEIVATGFINHVMPLIRYSTGDIGVLGDGCSCGRPFPVLRQIIGRQDDCVIAPDGRRIGRMDPIFKSVSSILETRIVQDQADHLRVEIVSRGELPLRERQALLREIEARVGISMRVDLVRVSVIARSPSGKRRAVVNLVPAHDANIVSARSDR